MEAPPDRTLRAVSLNCSSLSTAQGPAIITISLPPIFIETAGDNANGIVTTCQYNPKADNPRLKAFQKNYKERFGIEPDVFAAHAYDGMNMTIDAIRSQGLNKYLIRDYLTDLRKYDGITGEILLDASWNDVGRIYMAKIRDGEFYFSPAPALSDK